MRRLLWIAAFVFVGVVPPYPLAAGAPCDPAEVALTVEDFNHSLELISEGRQGWQIGDACDDATAPDRSYGVSFASEALNSAVAARGLSLADIVRFGQEYADSPEPTLLDASVEPGAIMVLHYVSRYPVPKPLEYLDDVLVAPPDPLRDDVEVIEYLQWEIPVGDRTQRVQVVTDVNGQLQEQQAAFCLVEGQVAVLLLGGPLGQDLGIETERLIAIVAERLRSP